MVTMEDYHMEMYAITMPWVSMTPDAHVALHVSVVIPSPWRATWWPFGVWHTQDIQTSRRAVDHIMDPRDPSRV